MHRNYGRPNLLSVRDRDGACCAPLRLPLAKSCSQEEAKEKGEEFTTGYGYHMELPRGQLLGCKMGYLKLVVRKSDGVIIGVHMIGALATELIHYGMLLVNKKSSIKELITHVFNFPTLHDLYKKAAYDAHGKIY